MAHPLVIAGGHAAFNPEPIADFLDAVVLGDGEQAVLAITEPDPRLEAGRAARRPGRPAAAGLSTVAYVPRFYDVAYRPDGRYRTYRRTVRVCRPQFPSTP